MGVFARLLRRSKATEETSTTEAGAAPLTAEPEVEEAAAEAPAGTEPKAGSEAGEPVEPTATESVESGAAEGVDIPKQQSADEAADRDAGDSART
ncbi:MULTISPECIES: hypothetical protein [unclassified Streptomyces]|uniref:hypothetical protein n=1 Tax=unclassified Streptomyces TaxID=2593676 RepID=UPI0036E64E74